MNHTTTEGDAATMLPTTESNRAHDLDRGFIKLLDSRITDPVLAGVLRRVHPSEILLDCLAAVTWAEPERAELWERHETLYQQTYVAVRAGVNSGYVYDDMIDAAAKVGLDAEEARLIIVPAALKALREVHAIKSWMADRFIKQYGAKFRYTDARGWISTEGTEWTPADPSSIASAVLDVLRRAMAEALGDVDLVADVELCEDSDGVFGVLAAVGYRSAAAVSPQLALDTETTNDATGEDA